MKKDKEKDKTNKQIFVTSKLREWVECDSCGARRCIFSMYGLDNIKGPSDQDKKELDLWKENKGYVCGNKPGNNRFNIKKQLRCGDNIETQYYDSVYITGKTTPTKGRKITTDPICCWCYDDFDMVVKGTKVKIKQDLKGKNQLPLCKNCYEDAVEKQIKMPTTGGNINQKDKGDQKRSGKRRLHSLAVKNGKRSKRR